MLLCVIFALYLRYIVSTLYQQSPYIPVYRNTRTHTGTPEPHTGTSEPHRNTKTPYRNTATPYPEHRTHLTRQRISIPEHWNTGTPYRIPEHRNPIPEHRNPIPEPEHSVELQCTYTSFIGGRGGRVAVRPSATRYDPPVSEFSGYVL